ncbi:hypothetical protein PPSIR1_33184 [Plesiocystis pacifica SIR-1]|uniref:DUF1501 domain-containing protein n=1 Tax=Plesiocystis pacifica SIR-1 TaxID=391625 RepID=A6G6J3_9BACT|nr:DUF1501 domain-containing protein [Plesiocystis pacifica]EDM78470.1 hypothetical protein PPSIR1_33184 [Plesiocystis pacifica SIR-1]
MTIDRRSFLRFGLGSGLGLGLGLLAASPALLRSGSARAGKGVGTGTGPAKRIVVLYMHGGASQIDTFDPKPEHENGGEFKAVKTSVSGLRISEHLPLLAARMHQLSLVRSLTAKEGNHDRARYLMHTGFSPQGGVKHAGLASHMARFADETKLGGALALPRAVAINNPGQGPGYLGAQHSAFVVPRATQEVRNLAPPSAVPAARGDRRMELWRALEADFADDHRSAQVEGSRAIGERAITMTKATELAAFELAQESQATRERYGVTGGGGDQDFGAGCLMARRLLEAGVNYVEVGMKGWDTHDDNFNRVRTLSGSLDRGASALIDDLIANGLWSETVFVWLGDFGRTPKLNGKGGRNHFPRVSSALLGGGPIRAGQVVGSSTDDGMEIAERPVTVPDLFATVTTAIGVAPDEVHVSPAGRPITTVDEAGELIPELT